MNNRKRHLFSSKIEDLLPVLKYIVISCHGYITHYLVNAVRTIGANRHIKSAHALSLITNLTISILYMHDHA